MPIKWTSTKHSLYKYRKSKSSCLPDNCRINNRLAESTSSKSRANHTIGPGKITRLHRGSLFNISSRAPTCKETRTICLWMSPVSRSWDLQASTSSKRTPTLCTLLRIINIHHMLRIQETLGRFIKWSRLITHLVKQDLSMQHTQTLHFQVTTVLPTRATDLKIQVCRALQECHLSTNGQLTTSKAFSNLMPLIKDPWFLDLHALLSIPPWDTFLQRQFKISILCMIQNTKLTNRLIIRDFTSEATTFK